MQFGRGSRAALLTSIAILPGAYAHADDRAADTTPQTWAFHAQTTLVDQYHPAFRSPFRGTNSLDPGSRGNETTDLTLFLGVRPWDGAEVWFNPEIDQGFGLSNTEGIAGFPNGEGAKVGKSAPYLKIQRLFFRQTIDLGGDVSSVDPDINQLGGTQTSNRLVITLGKFSVVDVFDHNTYADDSRHQFLDWALVDLATFDYAANGWGYTQGGVVELFEGDWAVRAGLFDLSDIPNSTRLESTFGRQFQLVTEAEEHHTLWGRPGALRLLTFLTHGRMGTFKDAIALSQATGNPPDTALVRHTHVRAGIGINFEQQLSDNVGYFLRAGYDDPSREPFEFIDVDAAVSTGLSFAGQAWGRPGDTFGAAFIVNGISSQHADYLNRGGLGILVGDGMLPHPGTERIMELYYDLAVTDAIMATPDYQFVVNPAYNRDRGPVSILGIRLHAQI